MTYRRIHQAANFIDYEKNPQTITRTDFQPKASKKKKCINIRVCIYSIINMHEFNYEFDNKIMKISFQQNKCLISINTF